MSAARIALFPGQGVQSPGMGTGLVDAVPDVFEDASRILDVDIAELCLQGRTGGADLESTRWAQPAVLVCSAAAFTVLSNSGEVFHAVVGHSVGEYAALVAADALTLSDAIRLIAVRAAATDDAGRAVPGGMAAVGRLSRDAVESLCESNGVALAADNGPGQIVISGPTDALERTLDAVKAAGGKTRRLEVSAAFHSPAMAPAAEPLARALADVSISAPTIEIWSPTTGGLLERPDDVRKMLLDQLVRPVRWRETVEALSRRGEATFTDVGPGRVVGGLVRRLIEGAEVRFASDLVRTTSL